MRMVAVLQSNYVPSKDYVGINAIVNKFILDYIQSSV